MDRKLIILESILLGNVSVFGMEFDLNGFDIESFFTSHGRIEQKNIETFYQSNKQIQPLNEAKDKNDSDSEPKVVEFEKQGIELNASSGSSGRLINNEDEEHFPLKEDFENLKSEDTMVIDWKTIRGVMQNKIKTKEDVVSLKNAVKMLWNIKNECISAFTEALRIENKKKNKQIDRIFDDLIEVIEECKKQTSLFSFIKEEYSTEERFEMRGLVATLDAIRSDVEFYRLLGE